MLPLLQGSITLVLLYFTQELIVRSYPKNVVKNLQFHVQPLIKVQFNFRVIISRL